MSVAKKANRKSDRTESRLLLSLLGRLERYMARAGLIAFVDTPASAAAPAVETPAPGPADTPAATSAPAAPAASPAPTAAPAASPTPTPAPTAAPAATPKPDDKPTDDKPTDDKPTGAPEAYTDFTLPEGAQVDAPRMTAFIAWAKSNNLTQEAAQQAMDMASDMQKGNVEAMNAAIEAQAATWRNEAKADKEFGGDKFDENLAVSKQALDTFTTPEFRAFLVGSKLGEHPEMIRAFYRIGKAISQDSFVSARNGQADKSVAQRMYPNMNP